MPPEVLLAAVSLVHAGFQVVVTGVVYPALAAIPAGAAWGPAHTAHSRRMSRLVAPLYLALVAAGVAVLLDGPWTTGTGITLAGNSIAGLTTALAAGPVHGRLGKGRTDVLIARLMSADRVRLAGALLAGAGSLVILIEI